MDTAALPLRSDLICIEGEANGHESVSFSHLIRIFAYIESIDGQFHIWCLVEVILKPVHDVSFEEPLHVLEMGERNVVLGVGCNQPCINKGWGMKAQLGN